MGGDTTQTLVVRPQPSSSERPLLGKVVDLRYRVLAHIGSGGMADVYEVEHVALGRRLAMKVLRQTRSANAQLARRFSREARAASRLASEHVVPIHDYGILPEGFPYFVMDLLQGQTLRALLKSESKLPLTRAVNIAIDVCLGLHGAHHAGLIHRDLKPENLWLSRGADGREVCVLLDFGVARFDGAHTTGDGVLVGTARYMSPEQIGSDEPPGPQSDLFSLGVVVYESLAGAPPFVADSLERTLFRVLNEQPVPLCDVAPEVPPALSSVVLRALAKKPEQRYASALAFADALRPFAGTARLLPTLGGPASSRLSEETLAEEPAVNPTPYAEDAPASRRGRGRGALLLAFAMGLLLGGGALLVAGPRAESAPARTPASAPPAVLPAESEVRGVAPHARDTATSASAPLGMQPLPPSAEAAPPNARAAVPAPTRSKTLLVPPPPSAVKPARSEPPRPTFDGRNPYLQ